VAPSSSSVAFGSDSDSYFKALGGSRFIGRIALTVKRNSVSARVPSCVGKVIDTMYQSMIHLGAEPGPLKERLGSLKIETRPKSYMFKSYNCGVVFNMGAEFESQSVNIPPSSAGTPSPISNLCPTLSPAPV
jgi:hypothetical protein